MTDAATASRRRNRRLLALAGVSLAVLALGLYAARRAIARQALVGWLHGQGIEATADVQAVGLSRFVGRIQAGPASSPDFAADSVDLAYGFTGFWNGQPLGLRVTAVTLHHPVVRASLRGGRLSVGTLDPLIARFTSGPPSPSAAKPKITIDNGLLLVVTDYGPVRATANAQVASGRLLSLDAATAPVTLARGGFQATLGAGRLEAHGGPRLDLTLDIPVTQVSAGALAAREARLQVVVEAPYPDAARQSAEGPVTARAELTAAHMAVTGQILDGAQLSAAFQGQATGWISDLAVRGQASANLRANGGVSGAAKAGPLRADLTTGDLVWSRKGGDAVSATLKINAGLDAIDASSLTVKALTLTARGPLAVGPQGFKADLMGSLAAHGGWMGMGPATAEDSADMAAVKRGLRSFRLAAPGLGVQARDGALHLTFPQPVRVLPDAGGQLQLAQAGTGYRLTMAGGGLPQVQADIARVALVPGGATAQGHVKAALSIGPLVGGRFDATGVARIADGGLSFTASNCVAVDVTRVELGANDLERLKTSLCPAATPLLTLADGDWRITGRAKGLSTDVPFLQAHVADGDGAMEMGQRRGVLFASLPDVAAQVADTAPSTRFQPLKLSGRVSAGAGAWHGDLAFADLAGHPLAMAKLVHEDRSGHGGVDIDTGPLTFAEHGLQPAALSPLAAAIGSPATGTARFAGRFGWTPAGAESHGTLTIPRLDFVSPAGKVSGLSGTLSFTSLTPLVAVPGQVLRADSVAAIVPLTDLSAAIGADGAALTVTDAQAVVGGGHVRLQGLRVPLTPGAPIEGVIQIEAVELHDLVEASPFGDRVDLTAKVSGQAPFQVLDGKLSIHGGEVHAIAPGRLSIQRTALTGVQTSGGGVAAADGAPPAVVAAAAAAAPPDTFTDFAYQAMENLAFDKLDSSIDSLPEGRLGVLFHVVGRHDPPQHQEINLSILDLIQRKFLNRPLALPSGTGVNLTLDTSINLDELLHDYADYQQLRSSHPVQP